MIGRITSYTLRHRALIVVVLVLFVFAGVSAFQRLPVEAFKRHPIAKPAAGACLNVVATDRHGLTVARGPVGQSRSGIEVNIA